MRVLGPVFAGTATENRAEMVRFMAETLGLDQVHVGGVEANLFELPDGSRFAVADPRGMGDTSRSVGFLVDSLEEAADSFAPLGSIPMCLPRTKHTAISISALPMASCTS